MAPTLSVPQLTTNTKPTIFLIHGGKDAPRVEKLYERLEGAGYAPWADSRNLLGGEDWWRAIANAIESAANVLVCVSPNFQMRGFRRKEVLHALKVSRNKPFGSNYIIPVRLEDCKIPEKLENLQRVDCFRMGGWERLVKALTPYGGATAIDGRSRKTLPRPCIGKRARKTSEIGGPGNTTRPPSQRPNLPLITYPEDLTALLNWIEPGFASSMSAGMMRFVRGLGAKLEPIVQISPRLPVTLVRGIECLALGTHGENFGELCLQSGDMEPSHFRLLLTLTGLKTAHEFKVRATESGERDAQHLIFTVNLDPQMIRCPHLEEFLDRYRYLWKENVLFEVSEKTTTDCLERLKALQTLFCLKFCADDYNEWAQDAKAELGDRVEMTKIECNIFRQAMSRMSIDPKATIAQLDYHRIREKPVIIEGVEQENDLRFLKNHWPHSSHGSLLGQGYLMQPGQPWENWTRSLTEFGLPGGHILRRPQ